MPPASVLHHNGNPALRSRGGGRNSDTLDDCENDYRYAPTQKLKGTKRASSGSIPFTQLTTPQFLLCCFALLHRYRRVLVPLGIVFVLDLRFSFRKKYHEVFGKHPIEGGWLGNKLDGHFIQRVIDDTHKQKNKELDSLGVRLPPTHHVSWHDTLGINTNAAMRELLVRRETRGRALVALEDFAEAHQRGCFAQGIIPFFGVNENEQNILHVKGGVPHVLYVPDTPSWLPPRQSMAEDFEYLTYNEIEMREFIEDNYPPLLNAYDSLLSKEDRISLWSVIVVYYYGGFFIGNRASTDMGFFDQIHSSVLPKLALMSSCASPVGFAVFQKADVAHKQYGRSADIAMLAASPRHPHLRCVMNRLETSDDGDLPNILSSFFDGIWDSSATNKRLNLPSTATTTTTTTTKTKEWEQLKTDCTYGHAHTHKCCEAIDFEVVSEAPQSADISSSMLSTSPSLMYVQLLDAPKLTRQYSSEAIPIEVEIVEAEGTESPVKSKKISLESIMKKKSAHPGWLCSRCLKAPIFGTIEKCSSVCPYGYEEIICLARDDPEKAEIVVEVNVNADKQTADQNAKRIPRIIHQTWFEAITADRYPQLSRLQKSWINSGWEYRFYTDEDAREYILNNFPKRFIDAFDAVIPGAYKADLFRYLVLMKEGGIYADIDIMLETTLDSFVGPDLSFFAPRDVVGEYADEPFCLWNGMIGAAPSHPFIVRAAERVVNLILQRADLYDMERDVCKRVGRSMESWKVRAEPLLLFSGPCALGIAVNDVLKKPSLSKLDIGYLPPIDHHVDHGDAMILVGDKYDMGAFRISDAENSFVVASTDMPGINKNPRKTSHSTQGELRRRKMRRKALPHYSTTAIGEYVWGQHNVYKDDLVNNEEIKFKLEFNGYK